MEKVIADIAAQLGLAFNEAMPLLIRYTILDAWMGVVGAD